MSLSEVLRQNLGSVLIPRKKKKSVYGEDAPPYGFDYNDDVGAGAGPDGDQWDRYGKGVALADDQGKSPADYLP